MITLATDLRSVLQGIADMLADPDVGLACKLAELEALGEPEATPPKEITLRPDNDDAPDCPSVSVILGDYSRAVDRATPHRAEAIELLVSAVCHRGEREATYNECLVYLRGIDLVLTKHVRGRAKGAAESGADGVTGVGHVNVLRRGVRPPRTVTDRNRWVAEVIAELTVRTIRAE